MAQTTTAPEEPDEGGRPIDYFDDDQLAQGLQSEGSTPPQEPASAPAEPPAQELNWQADGVALRGAHGDPNVWAHEMTGLIHAITGQFIDDSTIASWLSSYGRQVEVRAFRDAMFQVANTPLPAHVEGDPALLLLEMRNEIAVGFRVAASAR